MSARAPDEEAAGAAGARAADRSPPPPEHCAADISAVAASQARTEELLRDLSQKMAALQGDVAVVMGSMVGGSSEKERRHSIGVATPAASHMAALQRARHRPSQGSTEWVSPDKDALHGFALKRPSQDSAGSCSQHSAASGPGPPWRCSERPAGAVSGSAVDMLARGLPASWPDSVDVRWSRDSLEMQSSLTSRFTRECSLWGISMRGASFPLDGTKDLQLVPSVDTRITKLKSGAHTAHRYASLLCLLYDFTMVPIAMAWEIRSGLLLIVSLLTAVYWTMDIVVNFVTPFERQGELVTRRSSIAKRYLQTWFALDVLLAAVDWTGILLILFDSYWGSTIVSLRFLKVGGLLRALNSLRAAKFVHIVNAFVEEISGIIGRVFTRLLVPFICFLYLCHWIACIWLYIGEQAEPETGGRWPEADALLQYMRGFHLSVSVLCMVQALPWASSAECVLGIGVSFTGLIAGSAFVSSLSAAMVENQVESRDKRVKMMVMQRYLRENSVGRTMAARVHYQLENRLATRERLLDSDVDGVQMLSESLRMELKFEIEGPYMKRHALFSFWASVSTTMVKRFCADNTRFQNLKKDDELFLAGSDADCAFLCVTDSLRYVQDPESSPEDDVVVTDVARDQWLAEAALWCYWTHVGTAIATRNTQVFAVSVTDMAEALAASATLSRVTQEYCRGFARRLRDARPPAADWPNDLRVPGTGWEDLVSSMERECQAAIGMHALRAGGTATLWRAQRLTDEVATGMCVVTMGADGRIQCAVSEMTLRVTNSEGKVLVRVAAQGATSSMEPECALPGVKHGLRKVTSETMRKLFAEKLGQLEGQAEFVGSEQTVEWQASSRHGVPTKHVHHVFHYKLDPEACLDAPKIRLEPCKKPALTRSRSRVSFGQRAARHAMLQRQRSSSSTIVSQASGWASVTPEVVSILQSVDMFRLQDRKGEAGFFAWLDEAEFDILKNPKSKPVLVDWLSNAVEVPELPTEHRYSEPPTERRFSNVSSDIGSPGLPGLCSGRPSAAENQI